MDLATNSGWLISVHRGVHWGSGGRIIWGWRWGMPENLILILFRKLPFPSPVFFHGPVRSGLILGSLLKIQPTRDSTGWNQVMPREPVCSHKKIQLDLAHSMALHKGGNSLGIIFWKVHWAIQTLLRYHSMICTFYGCLWALLAELWQRLGRGHLKRISPLLNS